MNGTFIILHEKLLPVLFNSFSKTIKLAKFATFAQIYNLYYYTILQIHFLNPFEQTRARIYSCPILAQTCRRLQPQKYKGTLGYTKYSTQNMFAKNYP